MYDEDEESEAEYPENHEKYYLHTHDREECEDSRSNKWKQEKDDAHDDRTKIEEYHRIVELESDIDMSDCHTSRM
jgi:hypothetical protein